MHSDFIVDQITNQNRSAFHIVTVYKAASTPAQASAAIKLAAPRLFTTLIDNNWHRKRIINSFVMFAFLDDPGSRYRPTSFRMPIASAQDSYHHHCILLTVDWITDRILRDPRISNHLFASIDPSWSDLRKLITRQLAKCFKPPSPDQLARRYLPLTNVKSCFIQRLPTSDDVALAATYASKSVSRLSQLYPDDYLHILPYGL